MQELVIVTSCDIDFNDSLAKVEAVPVPWHLDGVPWVIDMCKEHRDTVSVSQMDDLVRMYGCPAEERGGEETKGKRKTAAKKSDEPEAERVPCPYPDCGTDYKNRGSLSGHFNERHGVTLATWEAEQAGLEPEVKCNFKGANCRRKFHTVQAMTGHKIQHHGWRKEMEE